MMATAPRRQTLPAGEPDAEHRRHVVSALVVDRPGTLNRVSGLLRARSFNIESLTVGTTHEPGKSRMTIAIRGDDGHLRQVLAQLERVIDVLEVHDLTTIPHVELELALLEVEPPADPAAEARLRETLAAAGGEPIPTTDGTWRARLTAAPADIDRALTALRPLGLRRLVRAGAVAMTTNPDPTSTRTEQTRNDEAHLRRRHRPGGARRPDRGGHRLRQPGRGPCAQPVRVGRRRGRRAAAVIHIGRARPGGRAARHRCGLGHGRGERGDDAGAGHGGAIGLSRRGAAEPARRRAPDVRPRLQHPLRRGRSARRHRRRHGRPEGPGSPGAAAVRGGRRSSGAVRGPPRRDRDGSRPHPGLRARHRRRTRRHPGDDLRRGDRDRPVRRAGRAVRRHHRAGAGRLRDAGRRGLPAGARLLRDDARAEIDRRPHVPGRPAVHALLDQRHRRVRRLCLGAPDHQRRHPGRDEADPDRDPGRLVRPSLDRGGPEAARRSSSGCAPRTRTPGSSRSGRSCAATWPSSTRSPLPTAGPSSGAKAEVSGAEGVA